MIIKEHLYLTEDGSRVVKEGDPEARWLHWAPGNEVKDEEYKRLVKPVETKELPAPAPKKRSPGRPKKRTPEENK